MCTESASVGELIEVDSENPCPSTMSQLSPSSPVETLSRATSDDHNSDEEEDSSCVKALMLRNIPCKINTERFVSALEQHGFEGTYNYLKVPTKKSGSGLGYCFVTFIKFKDAVRFQNVFTGFVFPETSSSKQCYVTRADEAVPPPTSLTGSGSDVLSTAPSADHSSDEEEASSCAKALVLRNIPYNVDSEQCVSALEQNGFAGTYKYVHVPTGKDGSNLGYCLVSFIKFKDAVRFKTVFLGFVFPGTTSSKPCYVTRADDAVLPPTSSTGSGSDVLSSAKSADHSSDEEEDSSCIKALMLRNVPCRINTERFVSALEQHGFEGTYNYLKVPTKKSGSGLGYCFISFIKFKDAVRFQNVFTGFVFPGTTSSKQCYVTRADETVPPPTSLTGSGPNIQSNAISVDHSSDEEEDSSCAKALVLRNIPYNVDSEQCVSALEQNGFEGTYKYVHVPTGKDGSSLGYCLVSFIKFKDAVRFETVFTGFVFPGTKRNKMCYVTRAE